MHVDDRTRLQHMLDAARDAITFIRGKTVADLARDKQLTLALFKCIEIMGPSSRGPRSRRCYWRRRNTPHSRAAGKNKEPAVGICENRRVRLKS